MKHVNSRVSADYWPSCRPCIIQLGCQHCVPFSLLPLSARRQDEGHWGLPDEQDDLPEYPGVGHVEAEFLPTIHHYDHHHNHYHHHHYYHHKEIKESFTDLRKPGSQLLAEFWKCHAPDMCSDLNISEFSMIQTALRLPSKLVVCCDWSKGLSSFCDWSTGLSAFCDWVKGLSVVCDWSVRLSTVGSLKWISEPDFSAQTGPSSSLTVD